MFQPIQVYNLKQFNKIPIHNQVFAPFCPQKNEAKLGRSQQKYIWMSEQKFTNFNMVFEEDKKQTSNQDKQDLHQYKKGKLQFVYAWNQYCLDVATIHKSVRYRFILGSSGPYLAQIKRRLLVVINQTHIYIHDLIRNNNRLICKSIPMASLSSKWLLSLAQNEHYIYIMAPLPNKIYPTLELQLYGIDMANNLNVELKCIKYLLLCQEPCEVIQINLRQRDHQVGICAIAKNEEGMRIFVVRFHKRNANIQGSSQDEDRLQLQFVIWQACSYLVNECSSLWEERYSQIRFSWFKQPEKQEIPKKRQVKQQLYIEYEWTENYSLIYKINSPTIIVIENCSNPSTHIVQHNTNILQIIHYSQELVYLVDDYGYIWQYDFQQYEEDIVPFNSKIVMDVKHILTQHPYNQVKDVNDCLPRVEIMCSPNGRLGVVVNGQRGYISYPYFLNQSQTNNTQLSSKYSTQLFLSVQSEQFRDYSLLNCQKDQYFLMPELSPFLSYSTQLTVNVFGKIVLEVLPLLQANLLNACSRLLNLQIASLLEYIMGNIEALKATTMGTIYDCQANQFYWILADLWFTTNKNNSNDLKYIIGIVMDEKKEGGKVLEIVLNQHQFKTWLIDKSNQSLYAMACATSYVKCQLIHGCACIYKRLLKQFICRSSNFKKATPYIKFNLHQDYLMKDQIVKLLKSNESDKIEELVDEQQQKLMKQIERKNKSMIKQVDKKWEKQFQSVGQCQDIITGFTFDETKLGQSTSSSSKSSLIILDQSQKYQNELAQNVDNSFLQKLHVLQEKIKGKKFVKSNMNIDYLNNSELLDQIYNLCSQYGLIFKVAGNQKYKCQDSKLLAMGIASIGSLYRIFQLKRQTQSEDLRQKPNLNSMSKCSLDSSTLSSVKAKQGFRAYWVLIIRILCQSFVIKYCYHKQVLSFMQLLSESITQSKFLPILAEQFQVLKLSGILPVEEHFALIRSWYEAEKLRFESEVTSTNLQSLKFRYNQSIWENGVRKLLKIYEDTLSIQTN